MKIGLIDVDSHNYPNLALMKYPPITNPKGMKWNVWWECELSAAEGNGGSRGDFRGRTPEHGCWEWWPAEPDVDRVAHGVPRRVDRLKCLGNAVVPQQFYPVFEAIARIERMEV